MALYFEDEDNMIRVMKIIRFICIPNFTSRITCLRTSGSEIVWYLGFETGLKVGMVLGAPVGYPLED